MTYNDDDAVIVSIARTPIGRARKGGLVDVRGDELARQVFAAPPDVAFAASSAAFGAFTFQP